MTHEQKDTQSPPPSHAKAPLRWGWLFKASVAFCIVVVAASLLGAYLSGRGVRAEQASATNTLLQQSGLTQAAPKHLGSQFTDAHQRLLADPPAADQLRDPATLVVAHWQSADNDSESYDIPWDQFEKQLSDATGRPVTDLKFDSSPQQIAQIQQGKITLVALHAADAPFLVNNYGYQPAAVLAGAGSDASGNHLDLIAPAAGSIQRPADLRGHHLVCVLPDSITGYRAAIALLLHNEGLRPNIDYETIWSFKQTTSIVGVAKNQYEAAAVSDGKLQSLLRSGKIKSSDYRLIYHSDVIPRLTIGWFYDLKPELADKIRQAILAFHENPEGGAAGDSGDWHFVAADYKKDFELVRLIDDSFDPRLDAKAAKTAKADQ